MKPEEKIRLMVPDVGDGELKLVSEVLSSGYLVDGPMTRELERLVAGHVGVSHAIAVNSGTTALEMCLRALGIKPGDEVIVPDFTHPASGLSVMALGARPVIIDVDLKTHNTDVSFIAEALSESTRAVMPVSWVDNPCPSRRLPPFVMSGA